MKLIYKTAPFILIRGLFFKVFLFFIEYVNYVKYNHVFIINLRLKIKLPVFLIKIFFHLGDLNAMVTFYKGNTFANSFSKCIKLLLIAAIPISPRCKLSK